MSCAACAAGRDAIEQTLDLHGSRAAPAQKRVEAFIRAAHANRCNWVLIITGKGEQGEGTLKKQTPIWLGALAEQGLVMGFDLAPQNMGRQWCGMRAPPEKKDITPKYAKNIGKSP